MRDHADKTAEKAINSTDKEWRMMANLAIKIRSENCNPLWSEEQSKKFIGIYKRLLEDPFNEVQKEARR